MDSSSSRFTEHTSITIHGTFSSESRLTFWGPGANNKAAPGYGACATAQRRFKSYKFTFVSVTHISGVRSIPGWKRVLL